ncbi:MAG: crossover junction endodeoxyribonuclease RuvC [Chitinophagaceae bacterium]|nr:crossover junction endodeoxyribonuclease RuvC [Chitinophagaceae bacterium]
MGFSIIEVCNKAIVVKEIDVLRLSSKKDNYQRLQLIHSKICDLIHKHQPEQFAIEAPFFGKNVQSMLKLGRAQGVAIAAAMDNKIPVTEYSPRKIKQAISGNGNADKEQIWKMLQRLVAIPDKPKYFDATDALAVAVCHHFSESAIVPGLKKKRLRKNGWERFAQQNPQRIL